MLLCKKIQLFRISGGLNKDTQLNGQKMSIYHGSLHHLGWWKKFA